MEPKKDSVAVQIIISAITKVSEILETADKTLQNLQQHITQVTNQKIGLAAQHKMLVDLKTTIEQAEK
jgi:uncharacterized protein YoxC